MRIFSSFLLSFVSVCMFIAAGCASTVKVVSDPPGAMVRVRGCGRPSYKWKSAGITPCEFKVPYSKIQIYTSWNDGVKSEKIFVPMHGYDESQPLVFRRP